MISTDEYLIDWIEKYSQNGTRNYFSSTYQIFNSGKFKSGLKFYSFDRSWGICKSTLTNHANLCNVFNTIVTNK